MDNTVCKQEDVCYNKKNGMLDMRDKVKQEIMSLTDKQAEYVLRRLQDAQSEKNEKTA